MRQFLAAHGSATRHASLAKIGGQYVNSQFAKMEAVENGFDEAIVLDINGYVSEGSGENIFVVFDGVLYTTPLGRSILNGITRDSVMTICPRTRLRSPRTGRSRATCCTSGG